MRENDQTVPTRLSRMQSLCLCVDVNNVSELLLQFGFEKKILSYPGFILDAF